MYLGKKRHAIRLSMALSASAGWFLRSSMRVPKHFFNSRADVEGACARVDIGRHYGKCGCVFAVLGLEVDNAKRMLK